MEQLLQVIVQALGTTKSLMPKQPAKAQDEDGNVILKFIAAVFGLFSSGGGWLVGWSAADWDSQFVGWMIYFTLVLNIGELVE